MSATTARDDNARNSEESFRLPTYEDVITQRTQRETLPTYDEATRVTRPNISFRSPVSNKLKEVLQTYFLHLGWRLTDFNEDFEILLRFIITSSRFDPHKKIKGKPFLFHLMDTGLSPSNFTGIIQQLVREGKLDLNHIYDIRSCPDIVSITALQYCVSNKGWDHSVYLYPDPDWVTFLVREGVDINLTWEKDPRSSRYRSIPVKSVPLLLSMILVETLKGRTPNTLERSNERAMRYVEQIEFLVEGGSRVNWFADPRQTAMDLLEVALKCVSRHFPPFGPPEIGDKLKPLVDKIKELAATS